MIATLWRRLVHVPAPPHPSRQAARSPCACHRDAIYSPRSLPLTRPPHNGITRPNRPQTPGTRSPEATLGPLGCYQLNKHPTKITNPRVNQLDANSRIRV
jgi:hypothetical protein